MLVGVVHTDHPEAPELVVSDHALLRFRERSPIREAGTGAVAAALRRELEHADISGWPPAWAVSDRPSELWAATGDLAFPLARTDVPGRWIAVTCLRRS